MGIVILLLAAIVITMLGAWPVVGVLLMIGLGLVVLVVALKLIGIGIVKAAGIPKAVSSWGTDWINERREQGWKQVILDVLWIVWFPGIVVWFFMLFVVVEHSRSVTGVMWVIGLGLVVLVGIPALWLYERRGQELKYVVLDVPIGVWLLAGFLFFCLLMSIC